MGDFSRAPQEVLAENLQEGYVGLHIEQGVPILDRDLNLMQDLIAETVRSIVKRYIGDGVPINSVVFKIREVSEDNEFQILSGTSPLNVCLVRGIEVSIKGTEKYSELGGPPLTTPKATDPDPRIDTVYLDVFLETVEGREELRNSGDVNIQTSVRLRPAWTVRVAENDPDRELPAEPGHGLFPLARLSRRKGNAKIEPGMIADLRQTCLTLGDVKQLLLKPTFDPPDSQFTPKLQTVNQPVHLHGHNFNLGRVTVTFGTVPSNEVQVKSAEEVVASVPVGVTGKVPIIIETDGGRAESVDLFEVDTG
jgi:hypothetical protein